MKRSFILLFFAVLLLSGCGTVVDNTKALFGYGKDMRPTTAEGLVMEAMDDFNVAEYSKAYTKFEEVTDRYPFSQFSLLAELKMADCKYYLADYNEAIGLYSDFEDNHPTNEAVPYVMFQTGMAYYKQIDTIDRDPAGAYDSIQAFTRLLRSFPVSPYNEEAQQRIVDAKNFLAHHELYVATYYIKREEYKQAAGRLQYILDTYPESSITEESQTLLAAVNSETPPQKTWRDWIPDLSLPTWKTMKDSVIFSPAGGTRTE